MLLLPVLLGTALWSCADAQATPVQSPKMLRKVEYSSATMTCRIDTNTYIHWYQQRPGQPPQRILYVSGETATYDDSFPNWKFKVQKHPSEGLYTLKVDYLNTRDSGVYYCAYWFYQRAQHQKSKAKPHKKPFFTLNHKL